ncbi:hypothetical protein C1I99_00020 [Micromonospora deserti]|uniref:Uncharacterized protein n=1 Tax=Micromonospora deserti TaxID=2070366 RepID=A0A2W2E0D7_9ACTN|nr:hypothetical protein C1I99_00020 [Micromonospora deserti]
MPPTGASRATPPCPAGNRRTCRFSGSAHDNAPGGPALVERGSTAHDAPPDNIEEKFPTAAEHLDHARDELLAFTGARREI